MSLETEKKKKGDKEQATTAGSTSASKWTGRVFSIVIMLRIIRKYSCVINFDLRNVIAEKSDLKV